MARSRLEDEEYPFKNVRKALSRAELGTEGAADLSRLLSDPTEFGRSRAPAHMLRAKRLSQRMMDVPVMGSTEGPTTSAQTSVKEGGFLEKNIHAISSALGQAGQAVMGEHQDTWQAKLGASTQQLAESRAYQETVSGLLGGKAIGDIPAARVLRPEQFTAAMAMKVDADKGRAYQDELDRKNRLEVDKFEHDLALDVEAGLLPGEAADRKVAERRAALGLEERRVKATELTAKTGAAREAKVPTPEEENRYRLDFAREMEKIEAPGKKDAALLEQGFRVFNRMMESGEYTTEQATVIANAAMNQLGKTPAAAEGVKAPGVGGAMSFAKPSIVESKDEIEAGGPGFYQAPGKPVIEKDKEGNYHRLDESGKRIGEWGKVSRWVSPEETEANLRRTLIEEAKAREAVVSEEKTKVGWEKAETIADRITIALDDYRRTGNTVILDKIEGLLKHPTMKNPEVDFQDYARSMKKWLEQARKTGWSPNIR